jgi:uncharacterized RDD family membrane protein YckC
MEAAVHQVCSSCGNPLHPDGGFCLFCGEVLKDHPTSSSASAPRPADTFGPAVPSAPLEYAGFWLRVWAGAIDIFVEALAALLVTLIVDIAMKIITPRFGLSPITARYVTGMVFIFVLTIGGWLYCAFSESSSWRATVGKRVLGLQVVTSSGDKLSFGQASVRHFMKFLSLFTATVGFMMAGWTKRRQALHDMPQDCLVVRVAEPSLSLLGKHN